MSRSGKFLIIAIIIALIITLFRMKAIAPAAILSFILFVSTVAERWIRIMILHRASKAQNSGSAAKNINMDYSEALEILELNENPTKEEVKRAYRRLIERNHPDKGGSKYLAAKINMAKDMVLKEIGKGRR